MKEMKGHTQRLGLTLLEVLLSIALLSVVMLALNATLISSLQQTSVAGSRTQAVQILNYMGRRIVGGETSLLANPTLQFEYGTLRQNFPDLPNELHFANPDLYRVTIENLGPPPWNSTLGVDIHRYRIEVCWQRAGQEFCATGQTLSAPPSSGSTNPPVLEGLN
ncbi:prepilin-type N-terminal cleavage/methylation domain-containing protein [Thermus caldifontis]|uniref:prepilin-type N-terminal cleavage/methylation domain-containing protein n=1 Tax=Thermus caldifontis TaxID=1930763 RepID=UPI001F075273|nr:prepilin-type N-terminal cleavage/methylation domain-containing protein [Thermus caldifontis]